MKIFTVFFVLFFPMLAFASVDEYYVQTFASYFKERKFDESLEILENWEILQPFHKGRILGMKAAVYLSMGEQEKSRILMSECIQNLEAEEGLDPLLEDIIKMYYQSLDGNSVTLACSNELIDLCKLEQPPGVKLRYWFGVGQVLVGFLAAPFSLGTSAALILSGGSMLIDAASDALDNKEKWERDLDQRQKINPDIRNNAFLTPQSRDNLNMQVI